MENFDYKALEGKWYIHLTTFPMWLKGDKTNPSLNYKVGKRGQTEGLEDTVVYTKKGKEHTIKGFDTPQPNANFVWRGKGLLSLLTSKWKVVYWDKKEDWLILVFEKTLFTPSGADVVSKHQTLTNQTVKNIHKKLKELNLPMKEALSFCRE